MGGYQPRRRLTTKRARHLVTDFERVTIRELAMDILRAVDLGLELGIYAYDAYIPEAARSSGFPLLALDGPIRRNAKKLGLSLVSWTFEAVYILDDTTASCRSARGGFSRGRSPDPTSGRSRVRRDARREAGTVAIRQCHRTGR